MTNTIELKGLTTSRVTLAKITHARGKQAIAQPLVAAFLKANKIKPEDIYLQHKKGSDNIEQFEAVRADLMAKLGWTDKQKSLANNYVNLSLERIANGYLTKEEVKAAEAAKAKAEEAKAAKQEAKAEEAKA